MLTVIASPNRIRSILVALGLAIGVAACGRDALQKPRVGAAGDASDTGFLDGSGGDVSRPSDAVPGDSARDVGPTDAGPSDLALDRIFPDLPPPVDVRPPPDFALPDAGTDGPSAPVLLGIDITPALATAAIATSVIFEATGRFSNGIRANVTALASWTVRQPGLAQVTAPGTIRGIAPGVAEVVVTYQGQTATANLTISAATLRAVTVEPQGAKLARASRLDLHATGVFSDGTKQDLTTQASWVSSDLGVATVSPQGVATGVNAGVTSIGATFMAMTGLASLTVTTASLTSIEVTPAQPTLRVPATQRFVATGLWSDGTTSDLTATVIWQSSDPALLGFSNAPGAAGLATAGAPGMVTVTARMGITAGTTTVTIAPSQLIAIRLTPPATTIPKGTTQIFRATGTYSDGTTADISASANWLAPTPTIVAVSNAPGSQGVATAIAEGMADVQASLGAITGSARVTVAAVTVTALALTPKTATVAIGHKLQFAANVTFSDGSQKDVTDAATFSSSDVTLATVSNAVGSVGLLTALGPKVGTVDVTVTYGGRSDLAKITVSNAALDRILVNPDPAMVTVGLRQPFTATGVYSDMTMLDITQQVTWSSASPMVAFVSNAAGSRGQATGLGAGTAMIRARLDGKEGVASLTVGMPELKSLSVEPINPMRRVGEALQFFAIAIYSNNTVRNVGFMSMWTVSDAAIASLSPTGTSSCLANGMTTITAVYMGLRDSTTLRCVETTLRTIEVTPFTTTIPVGQTRFLQATAIYSDGSTRNVSGQAMWSSSQIASVETQTFGRVVGIAPGMATITAAFMGVMGTAQVTVVAQPTLMELRVVPATASIKVGQTQNFQAFAVLTDGSMQDVTFAAVWTSSNQAVADVSNLFPRGQATGIATGMAVITASYMNRTGTAAVTVTSARLTRIAVSPLNVRLVVGQMQAYLATAFFDDGTSQNVTNLTVWSSTDATVANISNGAGFFGVRGTATALKPGMTQIQGSYMGLSDMAVLTVTTAKLQSLQVSPATQTLPVGGSLQYQAVAVYDDGSSQNVTALVTWTSSSPNVANVARAGFVMAASAGRVTIAASYMTLTDSATLTVTASALSSVKVTATSATIKVGQTLPYTATAIYADGTMQDVTFVATWAATSPAVVDVSNAPSSRGVATGLAPGMSNVAATYMGLSGSAALAVTAM